MLENFRIDNKPPEICVPIELTQNIYQSRQGKVIDQNYENKVYDQTLSGQANIKFQNGNHYDGNMNQGHMDGKGILRCFNGIIYSGDFKQNTIEGIGRYDWPDGSYYEGDVHKGLRHGQGIYNSPNKDVVYDGEWENGLRHGKGKLKWRNGQIYEGYFSKGFKNGKGKMTYPNGNNYDGDWKYDKKEGYGQMNWNTTNEKYMGEWKNNIQNGQGIHIWLETKGEAKELRNRYEGNWSNGERHGYGTFYYADGSKYEGEWKRNKKEGFGILTESHGEIKVGEFKADRFIKKVSTQLNFSDQPSRKGKKKNLYQQQQEKLQQEKEKQEKLQQAKENAKKGEKMKKFEQQKQEELETQKKRDEALKEERKRKMEIQMNPFCTQIDISDLTELQQDIKLEIESDLVQILLRHNSTIKSLYKSIQQKYDNTIGENAFCLDMKGFWQFCRETKILDSNLTLASINRCFFQGPKNKFEVSQSQDILERKVNIAKQLNNQQKRVTNKDLSNINMIEMLDQIKQVNIKDTFTLSDQEYNDLLHYEENQQKSMSESKRAKVKKQVKAPNENIHNSKAPILLRHFTDLLIRTAYLKYQDIDHLGLSLEKLIFQKIQPTLEKQRLKQIQSQTQSSNPSQVKSSSVTVSFLEDTDFSQRYKKAQEHYNKLIEEIFEQIADNNKSQKFGYTDRTCRIKVFYKMLISAGYIIDIQDKHIIFHVVEKCYDPSSLISTLDQQLKQADKHNTSCKKGQKVNTELKKYIDKQKQKKLIIMLNSEIILYEFSEILLNFLCRKDKDMAHTKNEENFKKKLGTHLQRIQKYVQNNSTSINQKQIIKQPRVWPRTQKDDMKDELAKERVIKNKLLQEQQREKELKMREARERLNMEKEDFNVPDHNEEEYEDFDESEIEIYDDDYLANF